MPDRGADADGADPRTGAELTAELLADFGIDTVFGLPGGPILPLIGAIENHRLLRFVLTRHEEAAVFLAHGYAQASGRPAAVLVTAGPGATHALTAAASANSDYCPVLVLTGEVASADFGRGALQDSSGVMSPDVVGMFR